MQKEKEIELVYDNDVWDLVELPPNKKNCWKQMGVQGKDWC